MSFAAEREVAMYVHRAGGFSVPAVRFERALCNAMIAEHYLHLLFEVKGAPEGSTLSDSLEGLGGLPVSLPRSGPSARARHAQGVARIKKPGV